MPTFLNDVPQATQTLGVTQPLIRSNFSTIDVAFQQDHVAYTLTGQQGKHNQVTMPVQAGAPTFLGGEIGLFNLNYSVSTLNELFVTNAAGLKIPMTAATKATDGWTFLASGILLKWGLAGVSAASTTVVTYPSGATFPPFANVFVTLITPVTAATQNAPSLTIQSNSSFSVKNSGSNGINVNYLSIGIGFAI